MNNFEKRDISTIIQFWERFRNAQMDAWCSMLTGDGFHAILEFYEKRKPTDLDDSPFNIFDIISDKYYREDFHSDMLAFFLDPMAKHQYINKGLDTFIETLCLYPAIKCTKENYHYAKVVREYPIPGGRIDILVKDDVSKHVIIIENKMNRAGDMPRQIPRYCEYLTESGYSVDCAVYLPLDRFSLPDKSTWLVKDYQWDDLIVILPAYSEPEHTNLVDHWLNKMAESNISVDCASIFRQYSSLIKKLSIKNMDEVTFDKFYDYLLQGNNLETANSLTSMMADLPSYLARKVVDYFGARCAPFKVAAVWSKCVAVFEGCIINGDFFKLDIWCDTRNFTIKFWTPYDGNFLSKYGSLSVKKYIISRGVQLFDDYIEDSQTAISRVVPITCQIEPIIEEILLELRKVSD